MFIHWALTVASVSSFFLIISFLFCCILFKLISCYSSCRILFCTGYVSYFGCCHNFTTFRTNEVYHLKYIYYYHQNNNISYCCYIIDTYYGTETQVIFDTTLWLVQGADVQKQLLWYLSFLFVSAVWQGKKSIMLHTCVVTYYFTAQDKTVPHRGQAGLPEWRLLLSTSDQTSQLLRDGIRLLTPPNLGRKQSYHKVMLDIWHIVFSQLHIQNTKFSINGVTHKLSTICLCAVKVSVLCQLI